MRPTSRQFNLSWQEQLGLASVADSDGQMAMKELVVHVLTAWSGGANETLFDVAVVKGHGVRRSQLPPTLRSVRTRR